MGIQASASRTGLVLACPHPFEDATPIEQEEPREPARYGSAFHLIIAAMLRKFARKRTLTAGEFTKCVDAAVIEWDVKPAAHELAGHVKGSFKYLTNWIAREKLEVVEVEKAYAILPRDCDTATWRPIPGHDANHRYACEKTEIPATLDLHLRGERRIVLIDHKTGWQDWEGGEFALPTSVKQMRTVGLIGDASATEEYDTDVGIFHADRKGLPNIYVEEYDSDAAREHGQALYNSLGLIDHDGGGFLRPGAQCDRCPARHACPAKAADLLGESTVALVRAANIIGDEPIDGQALAPIPANANHSVEERAGALYDLLSKYDELSKAGREEIRRLVRTGAVVETRRGPLTLQPQEFETVSKKSILTAYGKVAGQKKLNELRKKGAVTMSKREMLVPEKESAGKL